MFPTIQFSLVQEGRRPKSTGGTFCRRGRVGSRGVENSRTHFSRTGVFRGRREVGDEGTVGPDPRLTTPEGISCPLLTSPPLGARSVNRAHEETSESLSWQGAVRATRGTSTTRNPLSKSSTTTVRLCPPATTEVSPSTYWGPGYGPSASVEDCGACGTDDNCRQGRRDV